MSEAHIADPTEYALGDEPRPVPRRNAKKRVERASRRLEAFTLRRQGQSFESIGQHLGVSPQTVSLWVREAVRAMPKEERDDLRDMELARLDAALVPVMRLVVGGDLFAVDRMLRIMERRARYLNLDEQAQEGVHAVHSLLDALVLGEQAQQGEAPA
jgi:hypothetical protein